MISILRIQYYLFIIIIIISTAAWLLYFVRNTDIKELAYQLCLSLVSYNLYALSLLLSAHFLPKFGTNIQKF